MRGSKNLIILAVLGALSCAVAGCSTANFDPTDMLDFLDTKKKLPGERKPVFPEGVPGLEQGVPKDLYRGSRQQQIDQPNPATVAAPPPEEPQAKGAKSKGRSKQAAAPAAPPADPDAPPEEEGSTAAAPPPPKPAKIVRRRTTAPPPDPPAQQQQAQPAQQQSAFPAPLPSGGFQR
jgi:hypothetical protein